MVALVRRLNIAVWAAKQGHNSSGGGVWGCGTGGRGGGQTAAIGHRLSECGMERGAKEDNTHMQTHLTTPNPFHSSFRHSPSYRTDPSGFLSTPRPCRFPSVTSPR
eukprot:GHVU01114174.1.p3 GENE.GHVU01114174.1~~GHVU01114174.1.p3  ORF type:complete len:106 (+),score=7.73 GHVU01114174.1:104-421(+)